MTTAALATPRFIFAGLIGCTMSLFCVAGCGDSTEPADPSTGGNSQVGGGGAGATAGDGGAGATGGTTDCGTPTECAATWEENASNKFDTLVAGDPDALKAFLADVPKGGDLHNHLSGAVYAETFLEWGAADGNCINPTTLAAVYPNQCSSQTQPVPTSGAFYDDIVRAWSMQDFVPGAESGHDHFFSTFGKFGVIAGANRNESIADLAVRAASENQLYIETMFNLGKNVGDLAVDIWSGSLTTADLPGLYEDIVSHPNFFSAVAADYAFVNDAYKQYRSILGCEGGSPPAACDVDVRFMAQVSRTGGKDQVFGQLISAFEMAKQSPRIVAANLSSPEDATTSINNYTLHMEMLDLLHDKYTATELSPLGISLHAGELTEDVIPPGSDANTFHIRQAIQLGHATRIGHGLDVLSRTDSAGLLAEMSQLGVLVEVCLSSNVQILEVSGSDHPLSAYLENGVPVSLATDDQGVSRSSLAGEYFLAATDQALSYRQLKTMARDSLEHAFLKGPSIWTSVKNAQVVPSCQATETMGVGETPSPDCETFLDQSEKARIQWALEERFLAFESQQ